MKRPVNSNYDRRRGTSTLIFPDNEPKPIEYYVRGGICWPIPLPQEDNEIVGFALIAGVNVETDEIMIFEEREFACVDNIMGEDHQIEFEGVAPFFNMCWQKYYCHKFFYNQRKEMHRKYMLETVRSDSIKPKPQFIRMHWDKNHDVEQIMYEKQTLNRLKCEQDGELHQQIKTYTVVPGNPHPAMYALFCLLAGLQKFPWKEPHKE
jgi:hypothetical protein